MRQRQRLVAHMLERSAIEGGKLVAGAVIAGLVADRSDIERQPAALVEAVDVSIIGHQPVDVGRERIGDGMRGGAREQRYRRGVRSAGFEHVGRTTHPARLKVDEAVDVAAERVGEERARADQTQLLALVEQQDQRAFEWAVLHHPGHFEQGRDAHAVVRRTRSEGDAVVMRVQEYRLASRRPDHGDHVADPRAAYSARLVKLVAGQLVADDRANSHALELSNDALTHRVAAGRIGGMGTLIAEHHCETRRGALRVELRWTIDRAHRRQLDQQRLGGHRSDQRGEQQGKQDDRPAHITPWRSRGVMPYRFRRPVAIGRGDGSPETDPITK